MLKEKIITLPSGTRVINFSKRNISFPSEGISLPSSKIRLSEKIVTGREVLNGNKILIESRKLTEDVEYDILDDIEYFRDVLFITDDECGRIIINDDPNILVHIVKSTNKIDGFVFDTSNMSNYIIYA